MTCKIIKALATSIFLLFSVAVLSPKAVSAACFWAEDRGQTGCLSGQCWGRYDADEGQRCCEEGDTSPSTAGGTCVCRSGAWKDADDGSSPCITSDGDGGGNTIFNPAISRRLQGVTALANYIGTFWQAAYIIAGILVLTYLLVGAIRYITSGGDEKALAAAKSMMTNAIVGLVILAASYPIIRIVEVVFGIHILEISWPTV